MVNWNLKLWAIVVAVIVLLSASGMWLSGQSSDEESVSIVARVNNDGSGIFVKTSVTGELYDESTKEFFPDEWKGLTFMTPGPSSIQHMILMNIVKNELKFDFVQMGSTPTSDKVVFWTAVAPGQMVAKLLETAGIDGGIAWEPHYASALSESSIKSVMLTSDYWTEHPCCVIAANDSFLTSNADATLRFLSAYCKSVLWLNDAKDSSSANHVELINYVKENTTVSDQMTIERALKDVSYTYEITNLKTQVISMVETYDSLGLLSHKLSEIGYDSPEAFADALVNGTYIDNAAGREPSSYSSLNNVNIRVAYLASDIHQIALHIGIGEGFFSDFGITIEKVGPYAAGGDVLNALFGGQADLGFAGSPPVVLTSVNMAKVK